MIKNCEGCENKFVLKNKKQIFCSKSCSNRKNKTTHGMTKTREYRAWYQMKIRCYNPNHKRYHRYGGRGIKVCYSWLSSFENFFEDMGMCPDNRSLERKNNNSNYSPKNCIWATIKQQNRNKNNNNILEFNSIKMTMSEWTEKMGFKKGLIGSRLKLGWTVEKVLTTPVGSWTRK